MVVNASLPKTKIIDFLDKNKLVYVRHNKVRKPWSSEFQSEESIFTSFAYRKHHYEIDALDLKGDAVTIEARWYQSMSFFHKNKVIFELKK